MSRTSRSPRILLAMNSPDLRDQLLPDRLAERLRAVGTLEWDPVVTDFADVPADVLADVEVIFGCWGIPRIDAAALERLPRLSLVAYAAGTVKGFVTEELYERGVTVTTAAVANALPVAEFTHAMITLANKDILGGVQAYREPGTDRHTFDHVGNIDRTVGIIGASTIGRLVLQRLMEQPLRLLLSDPTIDADEAAGLGAELVYLDRLMALSDVVSLHAPILPSTIGMIGEPQIRAMRDGAYFINTARGILVDHDALRAELATGRISAVLDVTTPEPLDRDDPMRTMPNVLLTPHMAGSKGLEIRRMAESAVVEIERWCAGREPIYPVPAHALATMA